MFALERIERPGGKGGVRFVHTLQCASRRLFVIEQCVVEIEENGPRTVSRLHMFIIETDRLSPHGKLT